MDQALNQILNIAVSFIGGVVITYLIMRFLDKEEKLESENGNTTDI
jgi:uncharacterized membrane-anchored protein YhcB (DUF1043 family)